MSTRRAAPPVTGLALLALALGSPGCATMELQGEAPAARTPRPERTETPSGKPEQKRPGGRVPVARVVDGDTIEVALRGRVVDVRLIGVDAPETVHPTEPVECFGPEASAYTRRRLEGARVRLEFDVERVDPFGRTLAYVWRSGRLFNEDLVRGGYATIATYPPNVAHVERLLAAQRAARQEAAGLWGACLLTGLKRGASDELG